MGGIAAYLTAESVCVGDGIELETASSFSQPAGRLVPSQLIQLHFFQNFQIWSGMCHNSKSGSRSPLATICFFSSFFFLITLLLLSHFFKIIDYWKSYHYDFLNEIINHVLIRSS